MASTTAVVQTIKAEEPAKLSGLALYSRFALAGAVCCSVTHGALTPVDVYVSHRRDARQWLPRSFCGCATAARR